MSRPYQIINPTIFTSRLSYSYCQCSGKCTLMMLFSTFILFDNYMNRIISQIECMILMVRFQVRRKWTLRLSVKLQMFWLCLTNYQSNSFQAFYTKNFKIVFLQLAICVSCWFLKGCKILVLYFLAKDACKNYLAVKTVWSYFTCLLIVSYNLRVWFSN